MKSNFTIGPTVFAVIFPYEINRYFAFEVSG